MGISGFVAVAFERSFGPVPVVCSERGDGNNAFMMSTVDGISKGVSRPSIANGHRFWNERTPDLELTFIFLLAAAIVLSLDDKFGLGGNEMTIFSGNGESLEGAPIVNPDHTVEGENDVISADFSVLKGCGVPLELSLPVLRCKSPPGHSFTVEDFFMGMLKRELLVVHYLKQR